MLHLDINGWISSATLLAVLGLWGRIYVKDFQHKLMWQDYCERKSIDGNKFSAANQKS